MYFRNKLGKIGCCPSPSGVGKLKRAVLQDSIREIGLWPQAAKLVSTGAAAARATFSVGRALINEKSDDL